MPLSPRHVAARFDRWIRQYGQNLAVYWPNDPSLETGLAYTFKAVVVGMLQFTQERDDVATAAGVLPAQSCLGYFETNAEPFLTDRALILDQKNQLWMVHSRPQLQPMDTQLTYPLGSQAIPTTIGVGLLLSFRPDRQNLSGIPTTAVT